MKKNYISEYIPIKVIDETNYSFSNIKKECKYIDKKPNCIHRKDKYCESNAVFHACKHLFMDKQEHKNTWENDGVNIPDNYHSYKYETTSRDYVNHAIKTIQKANFIVPSFKFIGYSKPIFDYIDEENGFFTVRSEENIITHFINKKLNKIKLILFIVRLYEFNTKRFKFKSMIRFLEKMNSDLDTLLINRMEITFIDTYYQDDSYKDKVFNNIYNYCDKEIKSVWKVFIKKRKNEDAEKVLNLLIVQYAIASINNLINKESSRQLESHLTEFDKFNLENYLRNIETHIEEETKNLSLYDNTIYNNLTLYISEMIISEIIFIGLSKYLGNHDIYTQLELRKSNFQALVNDEEYKNFYNYIIDPFLKALKK